MKVIPEISIVVPLFNEEENINPLFESISKTLSIGSETWEVCFVDDGSKDKSFQIIKELSVKYPEKVRGVSLSRNFGHQVALLAGLNSALGNVVITMDADLQHPPEMITELYKKYKEGFDIVNTRRSGNDPSGSFKKGTSRFFYWFVNRISEVEIEYSSPDFRLMSRKAVDSFLQFSERDRFTRGLISWMGFSQTVIEYNQSERLAGKSKYSMKKMMRFGWDGITSFSSKPLRLSFFAGLILTLFGVIYAIYAVVQYFLGITAPGWTSILVSVLIIGGFQLFSIGIIGEYIARIFNEAKGRPLYFIKEEAGSRE